MIEIEHLTVRFGPSTAVRDVSLTVNDGESFGLVGESGSGKSTLLRSIMNLNRDWDGRISINGLDAHSTPRKRLARETFAFRDHRDHHHQRHAHQDAGEKTADEQPADRNIGGDAVDHHRQARRDDRADGRGRRGDRSGRLRAIADATHRLDLD